MKNIKVAISIVFGILSSLIIITILENGKDYSYFEKTDTNEELFIQDINYSTDIDLIKKSDIYKIQSSGNPQNNHLDSSGCKYSVHL